MGSHGKENLCSKRASETQKSLKRERICDPASAYLSLREN
jgi:hypothetical protein